MKAYVMNLDERPDRMIEFNKNEFPFPVERVSAVKTKIGADGCALTHLNTLKGQTEFPFIVFEDDCKMIEPWSLVEKAMTQLPPEWDALWLGATLDTRLVRYSENLFRLRKAYCTHAVIYNTPRMVDYILDNFHTSTGRKVIDVFYYRDIQNIFNCYITYPMTTIQCDGMSDIMDREQDESDQAWRAKCYNKYTR